MASNHHNLPADCAEAATLWVARRDAGLNAAERRELRLWLAADPRHASAFAKADAARTELDWPLHAGTTDDVLAGLAYRARRRARRRRIAATGTAATVLILALGAWWRAEFGSHRSPPATISSPTMIVSEPQRQALPDGSVVELKNGARIATDFSGNTRSVTLSRGTAHFQVTKGPQPFIVQAAGVLAQALGTAFVVELEEQSVSVVVTEGEVAVKKAADSHPSSYPVPNRPAEPLAILDAGKAVSVSIAGNFVPFTPTVVTMPAIALEERLAWRVPRLEFNGTPLVEVVAMINRYNRQQFVIADPALHLFALSGVLRADKVDALVAMLESDFPIKAERRDDDIILRTSR